MPRRAFPHKAESAYPVLEPLKEAIIYFQQRPDCRDTCFQSLALAKPHPIIDGLDRLAADFNSLPTQRTFAEQNPTV